MVRGGFRHLVVVDGGEIAGIPLGARRRALLDGRRARSATCAAAAVGGRAFGGA
jgi:hypothetical protein